VIEFVDGCEKSGIEFEALLKTTSALRLQSKQSAKVEEKKQQRLTERLKLCHNSRLR
jgi:hypothetical protein